jgi:2-amino-4-hydroxy-6-hydroxymethyldihydropteridine diphosphokinase
LSPETAIAYLGLGSSLGDRMAQLQAALRRLQASAPEVCVAAVSPVYESPHLGLEPGDETRFPAHLNCVVKIETTLAPEALLQRVQAVEEAGKRQRQQRWGPRTIDIDILLYGGTTLHSKRLILPHPGIAERAFVLRPLVDLAPELQLPDGRVLKDLLRSEAVQAQRIARVSSPEWMTFDR